MGTEDSIDRVANAVKLYQLEFPIMGSNIDVQAHFKKRLRAERERLKWSQAEMAKVLSDNGTGMHATTIAKIEAGDRAVRIDEAVAIADALDIHLDDMLPDDPNPPAALKRARRWADEAVGQTREGAVEMVHSYLNIVGLLEEHGELFERLTDDEFGSPTTIEDYLDWALKRTQKLFSASDPEDFVPVDGSVRTRQLLALVEAAVDNVVRDVPEEEQIRTSKQRHPSKLGRGLKSLIPDETDEAGDDASEA